MVIIIISAVTGFVLVYGVSLSAAFHRKFSSTEKKNDEEEKLPEKPPPLFDPRFTNFLSLR